MGKIVEEKTLHFEDETFKQLRADADQVLQKLLANMAEKGSLNGKLSITIDISFTEETVYNRDSSIEGNMRIVHTPKFQHKVGSVLQIKNEQKGDMNCDGMEMVWDEEKGEYILRPITGRDQMSIFDIEYPDVTDSDFADAEDIECKALDRRKTAALPGDVTDDYDYQNPDEI